VLESDEKSWFVVSATVLFFIGFLLGTAFGHQLAHQTVCIDQVLQSGQVPIGGCR
jgi:hypothetical protein